jgi:hypothetical protein
MSPLYVIVWIGYAFYYMNKGTTKDEAIVGLIAGLLYGAIWPVIIPFEIYWTLTKKPEIPYVPPKDGEGYTIADLQLSDEEFEKKHKALIEKKSK